MEELKMHSCSITKRAQIVHGCLDDYKQLARFHYRDSRPGPYKTIFKLEVENRRVKINAGVIVYTMPSPRLELRNIATGNFFAGFDKTTQLALINKNIRCIGRVIIEPRFRGLGLASRLVRETIGKMNVAVIEAAAIMGRVNRFFERAGMTAFTAPVPVRCVQLAEAFSLVGIEKEEFIEPQKVQHKLDRLKVPESEFLEAQMRFFLKGYGSRRYMQAGSERTEFILSKLGCRPVYYIWFNPKMALSV